MKGKYSKSVSLYHTAEFVPYEAPPIKIDANSVFFLIRKYKHKLTGEQSMLEVIVDEKHGYVHEAYLVKI